jgi:hypothetical protein
VVTRRAAQVIEVEGIKIKTTINIMTMRGGIHPRYPRNPRLRLSIKE